MPSTDPFALCSLPTPSDRVIRNPDIDRLVADCLNDDDCKGVPSGAVVAYSGRYTGRSPRDKAVVREPSSSGNIWWANNHTLSPETFCVLRQKLADYSQGRKLYVIDAFAGADPALRIRVRFILERAYHALFIKQLLIKPSPAELIGFVPDWTIEDFGRLSLDPHVDGVPGDAVIALNFSEKQVLIAGTEYAGEIKKCVFTIMNYMLPLQGVLSMHCSANIGESGDTALFFGLSGTGKTTLSADPNRRLIGDDEHGWSDSGVFNIEGGCYAKCINLNRSQEPEIWDAIKFGAILENVVLREDGTPDFDDRSITENTRVAYPVDFIGNAVQPSIGDHPRNIAFLTCDALGVLPPISQLTTEQAMIHYLNGYTAKVAGTESGVSEPTLTFSACFGQPFLPLPPKVYADLLGAKIDRHKVKVWLINTGWTGGPYGIGSRIKLADTRAMLKAAFDGDLDGCAYDEEPIFGLRIPRSCPGVSDSLLQPRLAWSSVEAYDRKAYELKERFDANYTQFG